MKSPALVAWPCRISELSMDAPSEKLLIKMWKSLVDNGIGGLLSPIASKRESRARNEIRREEILNLAQAESDAARVREGTARYDFKNRTLIELCDADATSPSVQASSGRALSREEIDYRGVADRAAARHVVEEINTARAVVHAEERLEESARSDSEQAVDGDWLTRWREFASKVSADDLQTLWGGILAGEVSSPGKYSFRTLRMLDSLSRKDAEAISRVGPLVFSGVVSALDSALACCEIRLGDLMNLQEIGVLSGVEGGGLISRVPSATEGKYTRLLASNGSGILVEHDDPERELSIHNYRITEAGRQIIALGNFNANREYLTVIAKTICGQGFKASLCECVDNGDGTHTYTNIEEVRNVVSTLNDHLPN